MRGDDAVSMEIQHEVESMVGCSWRKCEPSERRYYMQL